MPNTPAAPAHDDPFGDEAMAWHGYHSGHADGVLGDPATADRFHDGDAYTDAYAKGYDDGKLAAIYAKA